MKLLSQHKSVTAADRASREVLLIVCAGVVLATLDLFVVNVALPQVAQDLKVSNLADLSWVLNGYAIVYASLLVFFGRLADRYRRDLGFLVGVAVFTAASAACALSSSVAMLVAFRLVQAAGAALLTPTSLGLVLSAYSAERRHGAVRAWTATGGIAAAMGPIVGGLLVAASWRWVFLINVPIGITALVIGKKRLPAVPGHKSDRPSVVSALLATIGIAGITFGLVKGGDWGWGSSSIIGILLGGAAVIGVFALHCMNSKAPLVHPSLFKSRNFTGASTVALFFSAAFGAMLLSAVLLEQGIWHWSALKAGLGIAPGPLMVPIISFGVAGKLAQRFGASFVIGFGCFIFGAGLLWWTIGVTAHPDYATGFLGGMICGGIGVGLTLPTMMATASSSLPPQFFATGSAVINMVRQTGIALGVAVLVGVIGTRTSADAAVRLTAFRHGWIIAATLSFIGLVPAIALLRRPHAVITTVTPEVPVLPGTAAAH